MGTKDSESGGKLGKLGKLLKGVLNKIAKWLNQPIRTPSSNQSQPEGEPTEPQSNRRDSDGLSKPKKSLSEEFTRSPKQPQLEGESTELQSLPQSNQGGADDSSPPLKKLFSKEFKPLLSQGENAESGIVKIESNSGSQEDFDQLCNTIEECLKSDKLTYSKDLIDPPSSLKFEVMDENGKVKTVKIESNCLEPDQLQELAAQIQAHYESKRMEIEPESTKLTLSESGQPILGSKFQPLPLSPEKTQTFNYLSSQSEDKPSSQLKNTTKNEKPSDSEKKVLQHEGPALQQKKQVSLKKSTPAGHAHRRSSISH